jgi:hypothetical protein
MIMEDLIDIDRNHTKIFLSTFRINRIINDFHQIHLELIIKKLFKIHINQLSQYQEAIQTLTKIMINQMNNFLIQ